MWKALYLSKTWKSFVNKNPTDATVYRYLFTAKLLYRFRVSQHWSGLACASRVRLAQASPDQTTLEGSSCTSSMTYTWRLRVQFLILLMMGAVTPETCRVVLQWINICILLNLLEFYSHSITMHRTTSLKLKSLFWCHSQTMLYRTQACSIYFYNQ